MVDKQDYLHEYHDYLSRYILARIKPLLACEIESSDIDKCLEENWDIIFECSYITIQHPFEARPKIIELFNKHADDTLIFLPIPENVYFPEACTSRYGDDDLKFRIITTRDDQTPFEHISLTGYPALGTIIDFKYVIKDKGK